MAAQTGIYGGRNPLIYSPSDPLTLFLVQAFIIIVFCRIVQIPLSYIRQPKVIGEVIGGILLGKSVFGRIPNFTNTIFPSASMPNLNLAANIGLIFFLFIVGMEINLPYLKKHWKIAASVGIGSILVPFGLGFIVAIGLYNHFHNELNHSSFGVFGLFVAIAVSVTAFPVLARILIELGLVHDTSGIVVLAAGATNDIVAWILLALVISLAQSGAPINILWILLTAAAWFLFLVYLAKPLLHLYLKRSGSLERGPSELAVGVIIMGLFVSSFFTDILGIHPIFGAFLMGSIIPRENSFPAKLTAKIEDVMSTVFMPIYFAISGLNCDFASLNNGPTWGYAILVIVVALVGKVIGSAIPARILGLPFDRSIEVGILMSCKGLVELVVLNIGLETGILNTRIFSMFVLMAIVATVATTPMTLLWRKKYMAKNKNKTAIKPFLPDQRNGDYHVLRGVDFKLTKLIVAFDDADVLPSNMVLTQMLACPQQMMSVHKSQNTLSKTSSRTTLNQDYLSMSARKDLFVSAVHMVDLTERTTDLIQAISSDFVSGDDDPVMSILSTFSTINRIPFEGVMSITPQSERPRIIDSLSSDSSDLLLVSWDDFNHEIIDNARLLTTKSLDSFVVREGISNVQAKLALFSSLYQNSSSHVGTFIDRGFSRPYHEHQVIHNDDHSSRSFVVSSPHRQIIVPFFGGNDDWLAFGIALYLARNDNIHVTVIVCHSAADEALEREYEHEVQRVKQKYDEKHSHEKSYKKKYFKGLVGQVRDLNHGNNDNTNNYNNNTIQKGSNTSNISSVQNENGPGYSKEGDLGGQSRNSILEQTPFIDDNRITKGEEQVKAKEIEHDLALIPKPDTVWETVCTVTKELPVEFNGKLSLTRYFKNHQFDNNNNNNSEQDERKREMTSYGDVIGMYKLRPQDLVLMGRSTVDTDNEAMVVENSQATTVNISSSLLPRVTQMNSRTDRFPEEQEGNEMSNFGQDADIDYRTESMAQHTIFGAVTTQLVTTEELDCSFLICQAFQTRMHEHVKESDGSALR